MMATLYLGVAGSGFAAMPRNAFLLRPVRNVDDLARQIETEQVVRDRYRRHFAMNDFQIIQYARSLHVIRMTSDTYMHVYGVPMTGVLHTSRQLIHKGEKMFVDPQGNIIIRMLCGNPVGLGPRTPFTFNAVPKVTAPVEGLKKLSEDVKPEPDIKLAETVEPVVPENEKVVITTPPPIKEPVVEVRPVRNNSGLGFIPLLFGAILIPKHPNCPCTPVPEPASMTILAVGAVALVKRRKK